jgi:hypothetical protein
MRLWLPALGKTETTRVGSEPRRRVCKFSISAADAEDAKEPTCPTQPHFSSRATARWRPLFERYQGGDRAVVKEISDELTLHIALEEQLVYPLLLHVEGGEELRQEAEKEHQEVKDAIKRIEQAGWEGHEPQGKGTDLDDPRKSELYEMAPAVNINGRST